MAFGPFLTAELTHLPNASSDAKDGGQEGPLGRWLGKHSAWLRWSSYNPPATPSPE